MITCKAKVTAGMLYVCDTVCIICMSSVGWWRWVRIQETTKSFVLCCRGNYLQLNISKRKELVALTSGIARMPRDQSLLFYILLSKDAQIFCCVQLCTVFVHLCFCTMSTKLPCFCMQINSHQGSIKYIIFFKLSLKVKEWAYRKIQEFWMAYF